MNPLMEIKRALFKIFEFFVFRNFKVFIEKRFFVDPTTWNILTSRSWFGFAHY